MGENNQDNSPLAFDSWALFTEVATAPVTLGEGPFFARYAIAEFSGCERRCRRR